MQLENVTTLGLPVRGKVNLLAAAYRLNGVDGVRRMMRSDFFRRIKRLSYTPVFGQDKKVASFVTERFSALSDKDRELWKYLTFTETDRVTIQREGFSDNEREPNIAVLLDALFGYRGQSELAGFDFLRSELEDRDYRCNFVAMMMLVREGVTRAEVERVTAVLDKIHTVKGILSSVPMADNYSDVRRIVGSTAPSSALLWSILLYDVTTTFGAKNTVHTDAMLNALRHLVERAVSPEAFFEFKKRGFNSVEHIAEAIESGIDLDTLDSIRAPTAPAEHQDFQETLANANILSRFAQPAED